MGVGERRHLNIEAVLLLQGLRGLAMAYGVVRGSRTAMLTQASSIYPTNPYQITTYRHGEPKAPMRQERPTKSLRSSHPQI